MFMDLRNYVEITKDDIIKYKSVIQKEGVHIVGVKPASVNITISSNEIDNFLNNQVFDSALFQGIKFYINKNSKKRIISIVEKAVNIKKIKDEEMIAQKTFFSFFPSCRASISNVRLSEQELVASIMLRNISDRVSHIESYSNYLAREKKSNELTLKTANEIGNILTEMAFVGRLEIADYFNIKKNAGFKRGELKTEHSVMKEASDDIISSVVSILKKKYEIKNIFSGHENFIDNHVIAHSNRVFIMFVEFLCFYNKEFNTALASKIRVDFQNVYLKYYERVMHSINNKKTIESLEDVFYLGMRELKDEEIVNYSIAAFWHDIAKANDINYFAEPLDSDFQKSKAHVLNGYYLLKYTNKHRKEVLLTLGLHHEYYGHGYGIFSKMYEEAMANDSDFNISHIMTYGTESMEALKSFSYFPAKVLEIVDVYDILRYPSIKHKRKPLTAEQTLFYMRENFIEKEVKLDPIIFNLFLKYLKENREDDVMLVKII